MKNPIAFILATVLILTCSLGAAAAYNSVTVNPTALSAGTLNAQYEIAVDDKDSFTFNGSLVAFDMDYWEINGWGLEIGTRTYLAGRGPQGFFLHSSVGGAFVSTTYDDGWARSSGTGAMWTGTVTAGIKLVVGGITGEVAGGASVVMGSVKAGSQTSPVKGMTPMVTMAIGYSW